MKAKVKQDDYVCPVCGKQVTPVGISGHLRFGHQLLAEKSQELMLSAKRVPASNNITPPIQADVQLPAPIVAPIITPEHVIESNNQVIKKIPVIDTPMIFIPKPTPLEQKIVKEKQSQPKAKPIVADEISNSIKEDFTMDEKAIAELIAKSTATAVASALAAERATERTRQDEEKRKQEARTRGQEKSNNFYKTLGTITDTVNALSEGIKQVREGVAQEVSGVMSPKIDNLTEKQQLLQEGFVTLKASLPEDYCTAFPDLCQKVSEMQKILLPKRLSPEQLTAEDAEHAFSCPTCKQAFFDEAKKHTKEIVGDDIELLRKLAGEKGLSLEEKKKKKDILSF